MIDQELKRIWKGASSSERITINKTQLLTQLKNKMDKMDRKIQARDRRETIACIFGMILFAVIAWDVPFVLSKIASILTIVWFGYVIYRLKSARKGEKTDITLPFKEQLQQRKEYLTGQSKMLKSVLYWYILPPFLLNALFLSGGRDLPIDSFWTDLLPSSTWDLIITLTFLALFYGFIVWQNLKAAKENYEPLIKQINEMQHGLNE